MKLLPPSHPSLASLPLGGVANCGERVWNGCVQKGVDDSAVLWLVLCCAASALDSQTPCRYAVMYVPRVDGGDGG